ncbi:MAG: ABC transporter substrate-binding protein [Flavobacteriales bacterium]
MLRKISFYTALYSVLLFLAASCGQKDVIKQDETKIVFRYNESAGISSLDPAYATRFEDILAMGHLYNGLIELDDNLNVVPSIAYGWEISDDKKEYTFFLRNDVYFHDHEAFFEGKGRRVTAHDFFFSFFRILDPETASPGKYIFANLDKSERSDFVGFKALNDSVFKIFLTEPQPSFLQQLSLMFCVVVPVDVVEKYGADFRRNPIGTGPFRFKTWKNGVKIVLTKNEKYFEKDENNVRLPYLDGVSISFIQDRHQEYRYFVDGRFEMISGLGPEFKDELLTPKGDLNEEHADNVYFQKIPWLKTDYLGILVDPTLKVVTQSPLRDKYLRQAVNYAINRQELVQYLRNNVGTPAEKGFVPKGMPYFEEVNFNGYNYNPEKAMQLIRGAGYKEGQTVNGITLITTDEYKNLCEYIQHNLMDVGIDAKIEIVLANVQKQRLAQFQNNFFRKSWIADYADPTNFYQIFYSKNFAPDLGSNYTHFSDMEFDKLYEKSLIAENKEERVKIFYRMEQILMDQSPVVPLFYDETARFFRKEVTGISGNAMNMLSLKRVKIRK